MSFHVNGSSKAGATSLPALTLNDARAKADEIRLRGFENILIVDAGTGIPVRLGLLDDTNATALASDVTELGNPQITSHRP